MAVGDAEGHGHKHMPSGMVPLVGASNWLYEDGVPEQDAEHGQEPELVPVPVLVPEGVKLAHAMRVLLAK